MDRRGDQLRIYQKKKHRTGSVEEINVIAGGVVKINAHTKSAYSYENNARMRKFMPNREPILWRIGMLDEKETLFKFQMGYIVGDLIL